jgi:uncharacterized glyoxalase superfamily protein PhnB
LPLRPRQSASSPASFQAVYEAYRSRGVTFTEPPTKQPWGGRHAQFTDQDSNGFVLVQY